MSNTVYQRLVADESGQDIVEYALLGAVIGIASILIWQQLAATVGEVYGQTVAPAGAAQQLSSCMPGPDGTGC
jgi:Flp pilus assembly pilin Flp